MFQKIFSRKVGLRPFLVSSTHIILSLSSFLYKVGAFFPLGGHSTLTFICHTCLSFHEFHSVLPRKFWFNPFQYFKGSLFHSILLCTCFGCYISSTVYQDSPFLCSRSAVNNGLFIGSGRVLDGVQEVKKISGIATRYLEFFVWLESKVTVLTLFHSFKGIWSNNMVLVHFITPHLVTTSTSLEKLHFNQLPFHKGLEVSHLEVPWTQDIPMDPCTRMLDFESVIYTIPPFTTWEGDLHDHFGQGLLYHCSFLAQSHWTLELLQLW